MYREGLVSKVERKIIDKQEAIRQGLDRYYTGIPCRNGHDSERYADRRCLIPDNKKYYKSYRKYLMKNNHGRCVACIADRRKKFYQRHPGYKGAQKQGVLQSGGIKKAIIKNKRGIRFSQREATIVLEAILSVIVEAVKRDEVVRIHGFGKFWIAKREGHYYQSNRRKDKGLSYQPPCKYMKFSVSKSLGLFNR